MAARNVYNVLNEWKPINPNDFADFIRKNNIQTGNTGHSSTIGPPVQRGTASAANQSVVNSLNSKPVQGPQRSQMANPALGRAGYTNDEPKYQPPARASTPPGTAPGVSSNLGARTMDLMRSLGTGSYSGGGGGGGNIEAANLAGQNANTMAAASDGNFGSGGAKTGFGKSFAPTSYDNIWSNPEILIQEWLNQSGAPQNTGGGALTLDLADRMGIMWMLMNNDSFGPEGQGVNIADFIDWGGGYVQNMRTPGGPMASSSDVLNQVMSPGENTPLYNNMYNADMRPEEQINAALSTMRYGLKGITPALMAQSMLSRAQHLGRQYQADIATGRDIGDVAHFGDYLKQNRLIG